MLEPENPKMMDATQHPLPHLKPTAKCQIEKKGQGKNDSIQTIGKTINSRQTGLTKKTSSSNEEKLRH